MTRATCEVCSWTCETGTETDRYDLNRAMIDHHVETGHAPIEAMEGDEPVATETTDGSIAEVEPGTTDATGDGATDASPLADASTGWSVSTETVDGWTPVEAPTADRGPWR